jgi:peroxin-2
MRLQGSWRRRAWQAYTYAELLFQIASVANLVAFLVFGKYVSLSLSLCVCVCDCFQPLSRHRYRSVGERLLRMRLVYARPAMLRQVSFEYMNRQLVWAGFTEFLLFLMPLINLDRIRSVVRRRFGLGAGAAVAPNVAGQCAVCGALPAQTPSVGACGHSFCYYCAAARIAQDALFGCPVCGGTVAPLQRKLL